MDAYFDKKLSKNKSIETGVIISEISNYFWVSIKWSRKTDHAGFKINLEILWLYLYLDIYDHRHWDYENNCWQEYNEEDE